MHKAAETNSLHKTSKYIEWVSDDAWIAHACLLALLQRSQWYGAERLLKIQERKLRRLLDKAVREVEFYRELWVGVCV